MAHEVDDRQNRVAKITPNEAVSRFRPNPADLDLFHPDDNPEAPPLPYSKQEPGVPEATLVHDPETHAQLDALSRETDVLARVDPTTRRTTSEQALVAALTDQPFDPKALPDVQAIVLGMAKTLINSHVLDVEQFVHCVLDEIDQRPL